MDICVVGHFEGRVYTGTWYSARNEPIDPKVTSGPAVITPEHGFVKVTGEAGKTLLKRLQPDQ